MLRERDVLIFIIATHSCTCQCSRDIISKKMLESLYQKKRETKTVEREMSDERRVTSYEQQSTFSTTPILYYVKQETSESRH